MQNPETVEAYKFLVPQRRYGEPHEIAWAAVFLASSANGYIKGHSLNIDGGLQAAGLMYPLPTSRGPSLACPARAVSFRRRHRFRRAGFNLMAGQVSPFIPLPAPDS
jgi:Enoyl-(Acyl carrier protein) reductase